MVSPLTCSSCCVQGLDKGFQSMAPDIWLSAGNPWEVYRPELAYRIGFYGEVKDGKWIPAESVSIVRPCTFQQLSCCRFHNPSSFCLMAGPGVVLTSSFGIGH